MKKYLITLIFFILKKVTLKCVKNFIICHCFQFVKRLTCKRSCENKINSYCRLCSRVRDNNNFFDMDKFQDDSLFLNGKMIDLDIYLNRPVYFDFPNDLLKNNPCIYMEELSHVRDVFAYFCSILVRFYLNYAMEQFSELISTIKLSDEKFVIEKILTFANEMISFIQIICFFMSFTMC